MAGAWLAGLGCVLAPPRRPDRAAAFQPTFAPDAGALTGREIAVDADAVATALLVLGAGEGMKLVESIPGIEAILVLEPATGEAGLDLRLSSGLIEVVRLRR